MTAAAPDSRQTLVAAARLGAAKVDAKSLAKHASVPESTAKKWLSGKRVEDLENLRIRAVLGNPKTDNHNDCRYEPTEDDISFDSARVSLPILREARERLITINPFEARALDELIDILERKA